MSNVPFMELWKTCVSLQSQPMSHHMSIIQNELHIHLHAQNYCFPLFRSRTSVWVKVIVLRRLLIVVCPAQQHGNGCRRATGEYTNHKKIMKGQRVLMNVYVPISVACINSLLDSYRHKNIVAKTSQTGTTCTHGRYSKCRRRGTRNLLQLLQQKCLPLIDHLKKFCRQHHDHSIYQWFRLMSPTCS